MTREEAHTFLDNLKVCIEEHPIVADWLVEIADRKTEPQTCEECEHWSDTEDGCADRHGCKTENCSEKPNNCEDLQDWKDRMWAEAIVTEPTISKMEQVEDEPMKTTDYCDICKRDMCEVCTADATNPYCVPSHYEINYEPKTEPQTEDTCKGCVNETDCPWK